MQQFFAVWAQTAVRWPRALLLLGLLSVLLCLHTVSLKLRFSTDRTGLLDPQHPVQKSWRAFRGEFGGNTDLVVLLRGEPEEVRRACDTLAELLRERSDLFDDVFYRMEIADARTRALYFLSLADLKRLAVQLQTLQPWSHSAQGGVGALLLKASQATPEEAEAVRPWVSLIVQDAVARLHGEKVAYHSPWPDVQPESPLLRGRAQKPGESVFYNEVGGPQTLMLIAQPRDRSGSFSADRATVSGLRGCLARLALSFPRVSCLASGEPMINTDEMVGAGHDALRSVLVALVVVSLLLTAAYGDALRPLCAVTSLLIGLAWAFAVAAQVVGTLNLLTVHFGTILIGLSMTFAIQLLSHYQELRHQSPGMSVAQALQETVEATGAHSLIGAATTAVAFGSLHFTNFRAAGELGIITGAGVMLTYISILTFLPALLTLLDGWRGRWGGAPLPSLRSPLLARWGEFLQTPRGAQQTLLVSLLVTLYSLTWFTRVPFNYNVLTLQAPDSDSVRVEKYLQSLGYSSLYAVTTAPTVGEARKRAARLRELASVARVETLADLIPDAGEIEAKQPWVSRIVKAAGGLGQLPPLQQQARTASQLLTLQAQFQEALPGLQRRFPEAPLQELARSLDASRPGPVEEALRSYENELLADVRGKLGFLKQQQDRPPRLLESLPDALRTRSLSGQGNYCLRIFPRQDCWEREPLELFVRQLERSDPHITGSPLLIYYYLEELRQAYSDSGRNALLVICALLLLHFRSLSNSALALFPKLLGVIWMIGVMGICGVSFNAANFLALPITLGIGLIFGVNVLLECRAHGTAALFASSTAGAVILAGLTATIGFSSFLLASHRGVASFGFVMAAGVGANLLTSLITLPALLRWLRLEGSS